VRVSTSITSMPGGAASPPPPPPPRGALTPLSFGAGCVAGACGQLIGHPLDTIKVYAQTSSAAAPRGALPWRVLFRGCAGPVAMAGGVQSLNLGTSRFRRRPFSSSSLFSSRPRDVARERAVPRWQAHARARRRLNVKCGNSPSRDGRQTASVEAEARAEEKEIVIKCESPSSRRVQTKRAPDADIKRTRARTRDREASTRTCAAPSRAAPTRAARPPPRLAPHRRRRRARRRSASSALPPCAPGYASRP
jgi:hypothetical protein